MRYGVISDIHGNSVALKKVLLEIKKEDVKKLLIAGDFLGYYYNHDEVLNLLIKWDWIGICGNHDKILKKYVEGDEVFKKKYKDRYGSSIDKALEKLSNEQIMKIINLPKKIVVEVENRRILICHGSPWKDDQYIYPDSEIKTFEKLASIGFDVVILGHTHYPFIKKLEQTLMINPGSIGQPRDKGSYSSWVMLDTKKMEAKINRVKFDPRKLVMEVDKYDPEKKYLKEVLFRDGKIV